MSPDPLVKNNDITIQNIINNTAGKRINKATVFLWFSALKLCIHWYTTIKIQLRIKLKSYYVYKYKKQGNKKNESNDSFLYSLNNSNQI